jgi:hypothetical protein
MAEQPWDARHLTAQDLDGNRLLLKVYGRDARDAQVFSKMWRYLWYRDTGPSFTLSRLQQVEHEALVSWPPIGPASPRRQCSLRPKRPTTAPCSL